MIAALALALTASQVPLYDVTHALVGYGCAGASAPVYRLYEDDFTSCAAIEPIPLERVPACDLAALMPTDSNIEACTGRPWWESAP